MATSYATNTLAMNNRQTFSSLLPTVTTDSRAATVESTPFLIEYNSCRLHYWMTGPLEAPLVIVTHGEGANHHSFDAQVQTFAQYYRVLAWDIRGHGKSVSDQPFSLEMAVDDLRAILTQTGYSQAIFVGLSVGGTITQLFAQRFPEAVQGMALLSCTPIQAVNSITGQLLGRLTAGLLRSLPFGLIRAQMPAYFSIRPEVQAYIAEAMRESGQKNFLAAWQANEAGVPLESNLYPTAQPLLIALGAYDNQSWLTRATAFWQRAMPNLRPVVVPGAGHALVQDNPAFSTKMLDDFLRQCARPKRLIYA